MRARLNIVLRCHYYCRHFLNVASQNRVNHFFISLGSCALFEIAFRMEEIYNGCVQQRKLFYKLL